MEDVAIFWDYENCQAPANTSGYALVQSIRSLAQTYGSVKTLKAYVGITEQFTVPRTQSLRSELQCSGVSLIDCPHNGRKDVADKMMIVDMLAHAIDNPSPSTIILISGDRDFAYALSVLRLRCYRIILCTTSNAHVSLVSQASECIDWASLCSEAVDNTSPQWSIPRQPATPKIPMSRQSSQKGPSTSAPAFNAAREFKDSDDIRTYFPLQRKGSTVSFPSGSSTSYPFGNPKTATEFMPSASMPKWPTTVESPAKEVIDLPKLKSGQTSNSKGKNSVAHDTIAEMSEMGAAESASDDISAQDDIDSPSKSTLTFVDNDAVDDDDLPDPIPITGYGVDYKATGDDMNPRTPKTPSTVPLPRFSFSSNRSNIFTPHGLAPAHEISGSTLGYAASPGTSKALSSPKKSKFFSFSSGVPPQFAILIKVLQAQLQQGRERVLRSQVGEQVSHKGVTYLKAGVNTFSEYVAMAQKAGIVELGGSDGKAWIALTSNWQTIYVA